MKYSIPSCCICISLLLFSQVNLAQQQRLRPPEGTNVAINPMPVDPAEYLDRIKLPEGFEISIYADNVPGARSMALSSKGTLFLGTRMDNKRQSIGKVYAVADKVYTIAEGLNVPNGVALHDGDLYVAEINRIIRYDNIEARLANPPEPVVINDTFPTDFHHGWKYIAFGPDGRLYVPVGAPCNICEPADTHAVITSIKPDGSDLQTYAKGIRNTVGFDWHPQTGELWFTDNGRDIWGDNTPPEELNHAPRAGMHFGFPYRYGKDLVDNEFKTDMKDTDFAPAALEMPAHNAALGIRFYTGDSFPEEYHNQAFIASHGSWNRSEPDGYRVFMARFNNGRAIGYEVFADGWLTEEKKFWGRPVDIEIMADGSLLVSDDFAGVVYRIAYKK